jgi:hypothetical protein
LVPLVVMACAHGASGGAASEGPGDCRFDLSGSWRLEDDVGLRYLATDDGTTLHLFPRRVNADGSPASQGDSQTTSQGGESEGIALDLRREHGQVSGVFRMQVASEPGRSCPLLFRAELDSCAPGQLTLEIERTYDVNPACIPIDLGPIAKSRQILVRVK